jgi:hypothetical protein
MPVSEFRLFLNNQSEGALIDLFGSVQVDQAIGMAAEAELRCSIVTTDLGFWSFVEEDFAQPGLRVRVEVRVGTGSFVPLIDGPLVSQRFEFDAAPDRSTLTLVAQDDSVLLNQEEGVEIFEDETPDQIARQLFTAAGLDADVDTVPDAGSRLERFTVRRGTAMRLLRDLARRHGMFVYVRPGDVPGRSVGVLKRPTLTPNGLPELLMMGANRNVNHIALDFDAQRPVAARAASVRVADKSILTAEAATSDLATLGDTQTHQLVEPATVMLARTREEQSDLDAAVQSAVNTSSWAYSAQGEVAADIYPGVLQPHEVVRVAGIGSQFGGDYLVSRVTHVLNFESYRQRFTLLRNARLNGGGGLPSAAGVF